MARPPDSRRYSKPPHKGWLHPSRLHPKLGDLDERIADWMEHWGHKLHRWGLGAIFVWLGALKLFGLPSATSLIAKTIYVLPAEIAVPALGAWEIAIGVCLCLRPLIRIALPLLAVRVPGTLLALVIHSEVCFDVVPWLPTVVGQYLIKDVAIFGAALVIGGTVVDEERPTRRPHA